MGQVHLRWSTMCGLCKHAVVFTRQGKMERCCIVEWVGDSSGRLLWRRGMVRVTSEPMGREKEQDPEDTLAVE